MINTLFKSTRLLVKGQVRRLTITSACASKQTPVFNYEDPFDLDKQLTDEEVLIKDNFKNYCQEKLMTRILDANRNEKFDKEIMKEFGALGK